MNDKQNTSRSTGNLRGVTEQLPSFQKRSLKTGALQRSETAPLTQTTPESTAPLVSSVETVKNFTPIETTVQPARVTAPLASEPASQKAGIHRAVNSSERQQEPQVTTEKIERVLPASPVVASTLKTEPVKAVTEAKLAGVMAHETAHVAASQIGERAVEESLKIKPVSAGEAEIGTLGGYYETKPEPEGSALKGFLIFFIPLLLLVAALACVFLYVPALREKIPPRLASALRIRQAATTPVATLQEYRVSVDPKENMATISGSVTNISEEPLTDLQVEIVLFRREDIRQTETRNIALTPAQINPNQTATYELKVSARSYQQMKVTKLLSGQTQLVIKKLEPIDKATPSDYETLQKSPQPPQESKKGDSKEVYDGSITFK